MAYTIIKSNGTVLTTIPDGTINTTSTSLALPGRNYAGYGQSQDTNFVHVLENFANSSPPTNPLRGQLWYNTGNSTLLVCPTDGEANGLAWLSLTATSSGNNTTFGAVTVTGNLTANNITATNNSNATAFSGSSLTITANANIANANLTGTTTIANTFTTAITTGLSSTPGSLTGTWTVDGSAGGNALVLNGNLFIANAGAGFYGIKTDNYMYANGANITLGGTYSNIDVAAYLPTYNGNVGGAGLSSIFNGRTLTTGANTTTGNITGNWTLTAGSRLQATYADLAERYEIDQPQPVGTVVRVGGEQEITVANEMYDAHSVLGVISESYAFLMNAEAGDDVSHPAVALIGRVRVRVVEPIEKGDRITTAGNGVAKKAINTSGFGVALETNLSEEEKLVLCVIK
jgi:hypothetical protein